MTRATRGSVPSRPAMVLWTLAACFALMAVALVFAHREEVRFLAETAQRVRGDRPLSQEQLLLRYCNFAYREIRNPRFEELPPGVRLYYLLNPTHPGPSDVLRWGSDYRGGCGSHTRVVVSMLRASGVPARSLFLLDPHGNAIHTVVNALIGGRWVVADTYNGIVYRRRDGALATAAEIAADPDRFREQIAHVANYDPRYVYDRASIMNWQKVPIVLPAIRRLCVAMFGESRVASYSRPRIWMWPRAMGALACGIAAALLSLAAALATRLAHRPAPALAARSATRELLRKRELVR